MGLPDLACIYKKYGPLQQQGYNNPVNPRERGNGPKFKGI